LVRNVLVSGFSEMLKAMFLHSSKTHSCLIWNLSFCHSIAPSLFLEPNLNQTVSILVPFQICPTSLKMSHLLWLAIPRASSRTQWAVRRACSSAMSTTANELFGWWTVHTHRSVRLSNWHSRFERIVNANC
jgi:hypothetical protein